MKFTSSVQFLMLGIVQFFWPQFVLFSLRNPVIAPKSSVKYLSCSDYTLLKPLIHFSTARPGKRLVSQQIQVSAWSKHFTSHFTSGPAGGTISISLPWLHSPLSQHPHTHTTLQRKTWSDHVKTHTAVIREREPLTYALTHCFLLMF